jgi:dihydrofolate reductase
MARAIYYTAMSLDGYLVDESGSLDWLDGWDNDPDGPLGWNTFDHGVGSLIMGRTTFDWLIDGPLADPQEQWPHRQPGWVMTTRPVPRVPDGAALEFTDAPVASVMAAARAAAGDSDVWVAGGGVSATAFAEAGLVDELWLSVAPVVLGGGSPVFTAKVGLRLAETARNGDFAALRYLVTP